MASETAKVHIGEQAFDLIPKVLQDNRIWSTSSRDDTLCPSGRPYQMVVVPASTLNDYFAFTSAARAMQGRLKERYGEQGLMDCPVFATNITPEVIRSRDFFGHLGAEDAQAVAALFLASLALWPVMTMEQVEVRHHPGVTKDRGSVEIEWRWRKNGTVWAASLRMDVEYALSFADLNGLIGAVNSKVNGWMCDCVVQYEKKLGLLA